MSLARLLRNNPLCSMLGIDYPVLQAGMFHVAYGRLAAAVSNAGGLGVIGSAYMSGAELREQIHIVRNESDKPFGVDILFAQFRPEHYSFSSPPMFTRERDLPHRSFR